MRYLLFSSIDDENAIIVTIRLNLTQYISAWRQTENGGWNDRIVLLR